MIRSPDWRKARAFVATGRVAFGAPPRDIRLSCRSLLPREVNVPCAAIVFALTVACKERDAARQANGPGAHPRDASTRQRRAARPLPRLMVAPEGANCSGRDAVTLERRQATSVPGQRMRRVGCSGELDRRSRQDDF